MTTRVNHSHADPALEPVHPRGIYQELNRPFSELQAEATDRRAHWYRSDDRPKAFVRPLVRMDVAERMFLASVQIDKFCSDFWRIVQTVSDEYDRTERRLDNFLKIENRLRGTAFYRPPLI